MGMVFSAIPIYYFYLAKVNQNVGPHDNQNNLKYGPPKHIFFLVIKKNNVSNVYDDQKVKKDYKVDLGSKEKGQEHDLHKKNDQNNNIIFHSFFLFLFGGEILNLLHFISPPLMTKRVY